MEFVDHQMPQVAEEAGPAPVLGHQGGVEHIGIGEDDVAPVPQAATHIGGRISIEDASQQAFHPCQFEQTLTIAELVLGKGLGGEEEQCAGIGIVVQRLEDGEQVAEALARGSAGGDEHVLPGQTKSQSLVLVAVELLDARLAEEVTQPRGGELGQFDKGTLACGLVVDMHDLPGVVGSAAELI